MSTPSKYDQLRAMREANVVRAAAPKPRPAIARKASNGARPKGRPIAGEMHKSNEAMKPWIALGMSRRTWYRRKASGAK